MRGFPSLIPVMLTMAP